MAFPTLGLLDSFTRSDENPVSGGPGWAGPIWTGEPQLKLVSNQVLPVSGGFGNSYLTTPLGPDLECYFTLTSALAAGERVIIYFRSTVGSPNGYRIQFRNNAGDHVVIIDKDTVQIGATIDPADTFSSGDKFGVEVIGNTFTAYYKDGAGAWTNLGSRTDSTYTIAGYVGIAITGAAVTIDDVGGGTLGGGGGGGGPSTGRMMLSGVG